MMHSVYLYQLFIPSIVFIFKLNGTDQRFTVIFICQINEKTNTKKNYKDIQRNSSGVLFGDRVIVS